MLSDWTPAAGLILGYLLGSIPFGLLLTRAAGTGDIRAIGSGNIGATNVLRTGRKDLAAATLLLDALKGTFAVLIAARFGDAAALGAAVGAFLGHVYPVWLGFRGGKGVATFLGVLFGLAWPAGLIFMAVWLAVAFATRYSSAAALAASALTPPVLLIFASHATALVMLGLAALLWWKHRANIARLRDGSEGKIGQKGVNAGERPRLTDAERLDWLRLIRSDNIGPRTFHALLSHYRTARRALQALPDLARRGGARTVKVASLADAEREMEAAARLDVRFVASHEPAYPPTLAAIEAAPPLVAIRGNLAALQRPIVAVVGSRNASAAGLTFTERLVRDLARAGVVVASGLARGIDLRAHQASLETGTIAVLAGGHDRVYPAEHEPLLRRMLEAGAALSEMPMGWEARGRDFPRRNRLVSGLALATVVIEAARRSGSLITARFANEQGREVFAVPGSPLDPRAEGTNDLLRQGASLCTRADDVLEALAPHLDVGASHRGRLFEPAMRFERETAVETTEAGSVEDEAGGSDAVMRRVAALLGAAPVGIDDLVRSACAPVREVQHALLELELAGRLTRHAGNLVSRAVEP